MKREIVLLFHHKPEMDAHILCNIRYIVRRRKFGLTTWQLGDANRAF